MSVFIEGKVKRLAEEPAFGAGLKIYVNEHPREVNRAHNQVQISPSELLLIFRDVLKPARSDAQVNR